MHEQGRKNDYLSTQADNKFHVCPQTGYPFKPFPEGEERTRINAAFDVLMKALQDGKVFENAASNKALLDSVFGDDWAEDVDDVSFGSAASS